MKPDGSAGTVPPRAFHRLYGNKLGCRTHATAACQQVSRPLTAQVIPALNEMFDIAATRNAAAQIHPPDIILIMLGALALMTVLTAFW